MEATTTQKVSNVHHDVDAKTAIPTALSGCTTNKPVPRRRIVAVAAVLWALLSGIAAIAVSPSVVESNSLGAVSAKPTIDRDLRGGERIYAPLVDWGFGRSSHLPAPLNMTLELRYINIPQAASKVAAALHTQSTTKDLPVSSRSKPANTNKHTASKSVAVGEKRHAPKMEDGVSVKSGSASLSVVAKELEISARRAAKKAIIALVVVTIVLAFWNGLFVARSLSLRQRALCVITTALPLLVSIPSFVAPQSNTWVYARGDGAIRLLQQIDMLGGAAPRDLSAGIAAATQLSLQRNPSGGGAVAPPLSWRPQRGLSLLCLSDLHTNPLGVQTALQTLPRGPIVWVGDFSIFGVRDELGVIAGALQGVPQGYAVTGNHDTEQLLTDLEQRGLIRDLDRKQGVAMLERNIVIAGSGDPLAPNTYKGALNRRGFSYSDLALPGSVVRERMTEAATRIADQIMRALRLANKKRARVLFYVVHQQQLAQMAAERMPSLAPGAPMLIILAGHTHKPAITQENGYWIVNCGSIGAGGIAQAPKTPYSFARLTVGEGGSSILATTVSWSARGESEVRSTVIAPVRQH